MARPHVNVGIFLALLAITLLPIGLVSWSLTRSSEQAERGKLNVQVALSLQAALSEAEQQLSAKHSDLQSLMRRQALIAAVHNREGRILVGTGRGEQLPTSGEEPRDLWVAGQPKCPQPLISVIPVTGRSSAPLPSAPSVVFAGFQ